ncbi:TRIM23 [Acrasis kona]|uniref:TRIM23 n=1 Tax=Acrasis kona TaxID=1008807 RepID=A0AAW2YHW5_9EUKA
MTSCARELSWYNDHFLGKRSIYSRLKDTLLEYTFIKPPLIKKSTYNIVITGHNWNRVREMECLLREDIPPISYSDEHCTSSMVHDQITITTIHYKESISHSTFIKMFRTLFLTADAFIHILDADIKDSREPKALLECILDCSYVKNNVPFLFVADDVFDIDSLSVMEVAQNYEIYEKCSGMNYELVGCSFTSYVNELWDGIEWLGNQLRTKTITHKRKNKKPHECLNLIHLHNRKEFHDIVITVSLI